MDFQSANRLSGLLSSIDDPSGPTVDVYAVLASHQRTEEWSHRDLVVLLQKCSDLFIREFKLDVPGVVLRVDQLPRSCYGHFRRGHNGFGLKGEIAINSVYLADRELWEVLGTLLHELLHVWQHAHGSPGSGKVHNAEFRRKAESLGLIIDARGVTLYAADGPFQQLLRSHGLRVPSEPRLARVRLRGQSKLKKWTCACGVNVRCAVTLRAKCLDCGREFWRAD